MSDDALSEAVSARERPSQAHSIRIRRARLRHPTTEPTPIALDLRSFRLNIVVTCKGRLRYLKTTLPLFLHQVANLDGRVIVVDYGDPDGAFDYCRRLNHPKLVSLHLLDNTDRFNVSRARNCGANLLPCDILGFFDADSLIHPDLAEQGTYMLRAGKAVLTRRDLRDWVTNTFGLCFVKSHAFHAIRGYDEAFEGWGYEDADFYRRMRCIGLVAPFPNWLYPTALPHSNSERTKFNFVKDIGESAEKGRPLFADPNRCVNPDGYGRAIALVCRDLATSPDHCTIAQPTSNG